MIPDCKSGRALGLGTGRHGAGDLTQPIAALGARQKAIFGAYLVTPKKQRQQLQNRRGAGKSVSGTFTQPPIATAIPSFSSTKPLQVGRRGQCHPRPCLPY